MLAGLGFGPVESLGIAAVCVDLCFGCVFEPMMDMGNLPIEEFHGVSGKLDCGKG